MRVHFMAIGGSGVSALALARLAAGDIVSGCDLRPSATTAWLQQQGAAIEFGHDPDHLHEVDLVIHSAAVSASEPELRWAVEHGLEVRTRAEELARLIAAVPNSIAVAGTHGKTTTTLMIGRILQAAQLDPVVLVGDGLNSSAGQGPWLVAEADESDGSLVRHHPAWGIVLNSDLDHPDHYADLAAVEAVYAEFVGHVSRAVAVPAGSALANAPTSARVVTFGVEAGDHRFDSVGVQLSVPGLHNRANAAAAAAICREAGVAETAIRAGLAAFTGAHRRLQLVGQWKGARIYDDYGHHPAEVAATSAAAHELGGRLVLVFQPHRYSRYAAFEAGFADALRGSGAAVVVTEIYAAGEVNPGGVSAARLAAAVPGARFAATPAAVREVLEELVAPGDLVLLMGAGDIGRLAHELAE